MHGKWLVLSAAIFASTFEFGILFSLSALYLPILETFDTNRATAALVQSISLGVTMAIGIITGLLVRIFGCQKVSFVGAVFTPLGYIVSYFADSILFLIISLGIVSGIGISFIYVSSTVIVAGNFKEPGKSLALATVQTGVGIAGVFYPYLLTFLLETYGLESTFLITGGLFLNSFAVTLIYSSHESRKIYGLRAQNKERTGHDSSSKYRQSDDEKTPLIGTREDHDSCYSSDRGQSLSKNIVPLVRNSELFHKSISFFYNGRGECLYRTENKLINEKSNYCQKILEIFKDALKCCRDLFQDRSYVLFLLGDSLVVAFANGFIAVLVDIFTTKGYSSEDGLSAFLPYFLTSILGRILPGLLQQSKRINPYILPVFCAIVGGLGQLTVLFSSEYIVMMLGCCLAGLSVGGAISASSVVAVRLVNKDAFSIAFGLVVSLSGILTAISAPLNGFLRDKTGSYTIVLLVSAGAQLFGGVLLFSVVVMKRTE